ncbi:hypothetical protein Ocin01_08989 [Orchesella cincta]|uniref:Uncharacterized protein n=1 Tax=Orchesella cincta TaxID=48709 RepID=A0A1D2MXM4_ORCCI|nr:hypothetical protein Ocin01_08989 [Orchesella cincta]
MFNKMPVANLFLQNFHRRLPRRTSVQCKSILYIGITLAVLCAQSIVANPEVGSSNQTIGNANTTHRTEGVEIESSQEDDYYAEEEYNSTSWRDGNWRRQDNSKIAQVVVYCSVIVIALAGVLIKYFVTQYETSQLKAQEQLNYHRLQTA